ncbi:hypothetical protein RRG08_024855 [Elysia crispata]|uniref:Uncharacterized protein n=1 Tax=Elysia crispata TaxID=231223 RepID=A0AAE1D0D0_9GAST|nr:hypothetical protein RRG08_024855 [Elysia crispata]
MEISPVISRSLPRLNGPPLMRFLVTIRNQSSTELRGTRKIPGSASIVLFKPVTGIALRAIRPQEPLSY